MFANQQDIKGKYIGCMENNTSIENNLEMRPGGRNEAPMVVVLDKSSKSLLFYVGEDIEKFEEQVEDNQVGIEEARERPSSKYILQPFIPHQFK